MRIWIKPLFKSRNSYSFQKCKLPVLIRNQKKLAKKFLRIDYVTYNSMIRQLASKLRRKSAIRKPISVEERVLVTLR